MKVFKSALFLKNELTNGPLRVRSVGFVPTMGALHHGHLSLIKRGKEENDAVVVSIFVNPKQFNDSNDLSAYPRPIERDMEMLMEAGVEYLFHPDFDDVFSANDSNAEVELGNLDSVLEGAQRPGHFQGVAKVVKCLFEIITPARAYFGQKDFQQTVVIRRLVQRHFPDVQIVVCPILREPHGLAMSSRNERLDRQHRLKAGFVYKALLKLKERCHFKSLEEAMTSTIKYLKSIEGARLEYLSAVDATNMRVVEDLDEADCVVAVVVVEYAGVRLLDNIILKGALSESA